MLWCLWCADGYEQLPELVIRKAQDLTKRWNGAVVSELRAVRKSLKSPPPQADAEKSEKFERACQKKRNLRAEEIEQAMLDKLAHEVLKTGPSRGLRKREPETSERDKTSLLTPPLQEWGRSAGSAYPCWNNYWRRPVIARALHRSIRMSKDDHPHDKSAPFTVVASNDAASAPSRSKTGANDEALQIRIATLEDDHRDLGNAIDALTVQPHHDRLTVARLKKKKLQLKDEIQKLKNSVTPDIIA